MAEVFWDILPAAQGKMTLCQFIYKVKIHTSDPQWFCLHMDLALREHHTKFCMKLLSVICLHNYEFTTLPVSRYCTADVVFLYSG
jgi:hypothetical protein